MKKIASTYGSRRNPKAITTYTLKQTLIPPDMIIIQDTREQIPLFDRIPKGVTICSATLSDGDYSIKGMEKLICFERKAKDIYAYCTIEHEKTKKKMVRFKEFEFAGLVIEANKESDLYQFQEFSYHHPESIRGALISFQVRYGVHVYIGTRENCSRWMIDVMVKFWNAKHQL